jgi:predicted alpha-1,6-mannanase (GH76 family)
LEALYQASGELKYLADAAATARTMLAGSGIVREDGVLYEKLSTEGWDVGMFKGICARYFRILARTLRSRKLSEDVAEQLDRVVNASIGAIVKRPQKDGLYPLEWQEPPRAEIHNFNTQLAALIAIAAGL